MPRTKTLTSAEAFAPKTLARYIRIRDRIVIDKELQAKLSADDTPNFIVLIAREIVHEPGVDLVVPGGFITIVATSYDGKGATIDVSGSAGASGNVGADGGLGLATANTRVPGGPGQPGGDGGAGDGGGSIRLLAERLGDVSLRARGGSGGSGGGGGNGGNGGNGRNANLPHFDGFEGSLGGDGAAAGNGGAGGKGGRIEVEFTAAGVPPPMSIDVAAGAVGIAGKPGAGGKSGLQAEGPKQGARGGAGHAGLVGLAGDIVTEPVGHTKYFTQARAVLGPTTTAKWAACRLAIGVYFYRRYKPDDQLRQDQLRMASAEFDAVLSLIPGDLEAVRYQRQIELGHNVLGLPVNLDLLPDFDRYLNLYAALAGFVTNFYQIGMTLLLKGDEKNAAGERLRSDIQQLRVQIDASRLYRDAAVIGLTAADKVYDHAAERLIDLNQQIAVAAAKKPDDSISIGSIFETVGLVAGAVVAVIAAVPTAGTSLYALVPAIAGLTVKLSDIGSHLFEATQGEKDALKQQYDKVGKNVDAVVKGVKATVNLVNAIEKLTAGTTPSNAEVVGLMRQGVELAYELLLSRLHQEQASLTLGAREVEVAGGDALVKRGEAQLLQIQKGEAEFLAAGRSAVRATQRQADALLTVAFYAQRSVEIYTFKDASASVTFDSGYIHPDLEADFDEAEPAQLAALIPQLVAAYMASWLQFLDPIALLNAYDSYFTSDGLVALVGSVHFKSITDPTSLARFKDRSGVRSRISFAIDLDELSATQFEIKVEDVHVALVGVTSTQPGLSCTVRHGGLYRLRRRDGSIIDQPLEPNIAHPIPQFNGFNPLQMAGAVPSTGSQGRRRIPIQNLWGRGIGGDWQISVEEAELKTAGVDLSGLTEIQLWLETEAFVPKN